MKKKNTIGLLLSYLLPLAFVFVIIYVFMQGSVPKKTITINQFIDYLKNDQIQTVESKGDRIQGILKDGVNSYDLTVPSEFKASLYDNYLKNSVESKKIQYIGQGEEKPNTFLSMLPDIIMIGIMVVFLLMLFRRSQGQNGAMNSFVKNKAKLNNASKNRITFKDVAGLKEEKEELSEIVDFLKNPLKFSQLGARIPKGVLMVGPPGTGKTYLSKAVAGEAGVPFFSISGSDFVEMFVGVGASRVRELFLEGKKNAPCIIFIDEIDAVGRRRGAGLGGGNDEREQTLNQLLVEMDGFDVNEGIIIMAATNRPDILDPAILRPGRFDRQVFIGLPDLQEREEMLKVHLRNKRVREDVDVHKIARSTGGYTPADLENVCNEAALLTARANLSEITPQIFEEAIIKVIAGPEKKSKRVIEQERKLTAYHEAGHAIVTKAIPNTDTVNMITIVPRGRAGGFTSFLPNEDRSYMSRNEMKSRLISFLGGRVAESLTLDDISTGASNDLERATKLARSMVVRYGMTEELGPISYEEEGEDVFLGKDFGKVRSYSEDTALRIDRQVEKLMRTSYEKAQKILTENMALLHELAKRLLEKETIHKEEFDQLFDEYGKSISSIEEGM